jgi:quaternary ammonium compound-resistance protein SugE
MRVWIYILLAALFQTIWGFVLKRLNFELIGNFISQSDLLSPLFFVELIPLIAYLLLGLFIVIVISKAYKLLPMSIVYAAWMGLTLLFQVLVDALYFHEKMYLIQYGCITIILIGVIGMKQSGKKDIIHDEEKLIDELTNHSCEANISSNKIILTNE